MKVERCICFVLWQCCTPLSFAAFNCSILFPEPQENSEDRQEYFLDYVLNVHPYCMEEFLETAPSQVSRSFLCIPGGALFVSKLNLSVVFCTDQLSPARLS